MTIFVVDTNVAIVANGRETHADLECQLECAKRLKLLAERGIVALDDRRLIIDEYRGRLNSSGMPGVGDAFLKHLFNNQHQNNRVRKVAVKPSDDRRGFEGLPENAFDRSDRKFLAVAVAAEAVVLNATDSDWNEHKELLEKVGVKVCQLCPRHASKGT